MQYLELAKRQHRLLLILKCTVHVISITSQIGYKAVSLKQSYAEELQTTLNEARGSLSKVKNFVYATNDKKCVMISKLNLRMSMVHL
jgi:hypothetical protein